MPFTSTVVATLLALWNQGPNAMQGVPTGYPGPDGHTAVMGTAAAMLTLMDQGVPHISRPLSEMKLYLMTMQGGDGGYGSTLQTALVIKALNEAEVGDSPVQRALEYMAKAQRPKGGWVPTPRAGAETSPMTTGYIIAVAGDVRALRKTVNWSAALSVPKTASLQSADGRIGDLPTTQYWLQAAARGQAKGASIDVRAARRWYDEQPNTPAAVRELVAKNDAAAFDALVADPIVSKAEGVNSLRGIKAAIAILRHLGSPTDLPTIEKLDAMQLADAG